MLGALDSSHWAQVRCLGQRFVFPFFLLHLSHRKYYIYGGMYGSHGRAFSQGSSHQVSSVQVGMLVRSVPYKAIMSTWGGGGAAIFKSM